MITFSCPACGKIYQVKDEDAGRTGRCTCGQPMEVPRSVARPPIAKLLATDPPSPTAKPTSSPQPSTPLATDSPALTAATKATAPSSTPIKSAPITTKNAAPTAPNADETLDLELAPDEAPPSLPEPIDDLVPTSSALPPRQYISDEPTEKKSISGLSSLSAAGLTILVLAATALGSWLYLRQQTPETEKITVAAAPATNNLTPKSSGTASVATASKNAESNLPSANASAEKSNQKPPTEKLVNEKNAAEQTPASEVATSRGGNNAPPSDSSNSGTHPPPNQIDTPAKDQSQETTTSGATAGSANAAGAGAAQPSKDDRFKRMLSDLKTHREGRQDQSMSIGEAIDLCEFYPEHLPKVRFQGCLVHSPILNETSLKQRYGDPDSVTELSDGSINVQGRTFDSTSKPSKVLRYDWLEIYVTNSDGEIWALKRVNEPPPAKN
ncbi:MAG TPA: hypothetical protein VGI75_13995 [Pirellulales bacterium]